MNPIPDPRNFKRGRHMTRAQHHEWRGRWLALNRPRVTRYRGPGALALALLALAIALLTGCGASKYAIGRASLATAHKANQEALGEWSKHLRRAYEAIPAPGQTADDATKALADLDAKADRVDAAFRAVDRGLRGGHAAIRIAESTKGALDQGAILATAVQGVLAVVEACKAAGFDPTPWLRGIPGLSTVLGGGR